LNLLVASQRIEGFLAFLSDARPSAILTEYDRNHLWSCLILAARQLGIPTVTLVHGVMGPEAIGFAPVLADVIACWGESDRKKLLAAGVPARTIKIGGCPRLSRDIGFAQVEARERLGLDPKARIVLLATSPDRGFLELAELFCRGLHATPDLLGVVRLHPAETKAAYTQVAERYPGVRFMENSEASLDESLAATDIVVVRGSGFGSDALIKRRPVVVLNPDTWSTGHDQDLVESAGCPRAGTAEELSATLSRSLSDDAFRRKLASAAEDYVADFCAAFGPESARLIADIVEGTLDQSRMR
jgi:hypothetical protein